MEKVVRGHYAVGFQSREKGGGRRGECVATMQWASVGHGRCRALQRTERDLHRDRAASAVRGAPTRASHALPSSPSSLFPTLRSGLPLGTADAVPCRGQRGIYTWIARHLPCEARPRAPATHFSLHSPPYSLLFLYSDCVEDCEECDPHVGEDSFPEGCLSEA